MNEEVELRVELIENRCDLPLSAQQWDELIAGNEVNTVFQTFAWFDAWWQSFGAQHRLFFLVVYQADRVIGFAALMLTAVVSGWNRLEFVGTGSADYQDFVLPVHKRAAVHAICAFLRAHVSTWQRAWLCNIPTHSSTLQYLAEARQASGLRLIHEAEVPCPVLRLHANEDAVRRRLGKYSMRRPLNWFAKRGQVRFRHVSAWPEVEALLPAFFDQHIRRWRAAGRASLFQRTAQQSFYRVLAQAAHREGWLLFSVVELDGRPIAFHFGFDYLGSVIWYKPAFEIGHAEHSPGLLLIQQLIEDGLSRGRHEIDFTIGDEPFKGRFSNAERANAYIGVYHNRAAYLLALAEKTARRAAGRLLRGVRSSVGRVLAKLPHMKTPARRS